MKLRRYIKDGREGRWEARRKPKMKNMAPSSSSSSSSPLHYQPYHFNPIIQNGERAGQEDEYSRATPSDCTETGVTPKHYPTPLHHSHGCDKIGKPYSKKRPESGSVSSGDGSILCNKCRPHARDKFSVVPLDNNGMAKHSFSMASPNGIFKSIISSLTRKSPKSMNEGADWTAREEHWKIALGEISNKLIQATRKRDEALLEASKLKYSMAELEKKLNKLEIYCHSLKSGLDECSANPANYQMGKGQGPNILQKPKQEVLGGVLVSDKVIENFLVSVSESRSSVRQLSRSLTMQLRHMGTKIYERIQLLLQPYDIKISLSKNPKTMLILYLEALLNRAFFEDFESIGFQKNSPNQILNPSDRSEANLASFNLLQGLTWEEVLNKGTRQFSEEFSRFCDRKMSDIVAMLEWNRAWPEPLLQAFFCASKSVWLVHLLATAVQPSLPIFRVESGVSFDGIYMEDMGGDKTKDLIPATVRIMVSPGFYVYDSLIKCKVLCRYFTNHNN